MSGPTGATGATGAAGTGPITALPPFLSALERRLAAEEHKLAPPLRPVPERWRPRSSAVLLLLAGTGTGDASLLLEERAHTMRSQPAQFALPGGRVEPTDADEVATALRETREETGLDPALVRVVGSFAPIPMPWRNFQVRPVVGWMPARPTLGCVEPQEVASLVWAPLTGPRSLSDPAVRRTGMLDGVPAGTAFDLPGDAFVWGFTAMILDALLGELGIEVPGDGTPPAPEEVPELRRRAGL